MLEEEQYIFLNDVVLLRIAQRLRTEHLYPLTAALLETVDYVDDVKADFADLGQAEHAFLVMAEWRRRALNQKRNLTAGQLVEVLTEAKIDHHIVMSGTYTCFRGLLFTVSFS